jgi:single-stranded-DNA-specific exonuclease
MFPLHSPVETALREELSEYDDLTAALLARRGITTKAQALTFLSPSYDEHIHDPLLIKNMRGAAEMLAAAIQSGERICVWSDYDCDGIPGGVLLHDFLKKAGANFENYIPHRHDEGYGLNIPGLEKLAKSGVQLVVTVDSGITDVEQVARAKELGMKVIVTDHHLPAAELPPADFVIDQKQKGETSPYQELCGAAIAWKLACATLAVAPALREKVPEGWEKWLLDMAGLATIADMVPLTGENRVIARYGLLVMRKSPRIGLQKLCRVARVEQRAITEGDVGFMLAPRINAASRMLDPRDAFDLLTTTDEALADELAKKLEKANKSRRASAGAITREVNERIAQRLAENPGVELPAVIAIGNPEWRPALLGLVANGVVEEYSRPVFLWGREADNRIKGSCRTDGTVNVVNLMTATPDTFVEFGGHAASGGFTVRDDAVFFLEERLSEMKLKMVQEEKEDAFSHADAELDPDEVTPTLLAKLERLAPFGEGNAKPIFIFRNVELQEVSRFGKGTEHLRMLINRTFQSEFSKPLEAISFFAKRELGSHCFDFDRGHHVNILAHLERNQFSKFGSVRLRLVDVRPI